MRSGGDEAIGSCEVHRTPVVAMRYNAAHDSVISVDQKGRSLSRHPLVCIHLGHQLFEPLLDIIDKYKVNGTLLFP